jgi:hypothetical protein
VRSPLAIRRRAIKALAVYHLLRAGS